jgi:hypothetical protein
LPANLALGDWAVHLLDKSISATAEKAQFKVSVIDLSQFEIIELNNTRQTIKRDSDVVLIATIDEHS